jgi:pilus assembly protein CpaF
LSRLDAENAREEIRDIVHEIVAIKNVAVSIGEQADLIDDFAMMFLATGPSNLFLAATTLPTSW